MADVESASVLNGPGHAYGHGHGHGIFISNFEKLGLGNHWSPRGAGVGLVAAAVNAHAVTV